MQTLPWYEVPDGLIAYYTFDEQDASDELGNHHGEVWGPEFTSDVVSGTSGHSCTLNAEEQDYILFPQSPVPDGIRALSFSFWMKTTSTTHGIFHCTTPNSGSSQFSNFSIVDNYWKSKMYDNGGKVTIDYNMSNYLNGSWHHFTFLYDSDLNFHKLYIDGQYKGERYDGSSAGINSSASGTLGFYYVYASAYYYLDGKIDNFRIYNRVLTEEEIVTLFNLKQ